MTDNPTPGRNFLNLPAAFRPKPELTDQERAAGLHMMRWQAMAASGADGLATGGFLAAFALILGASNLQIGILTAIPFIMQPLQIFAVVVVERLRTRKIIAVAAYFVAYSSWIPIAIIPFLMDVPSAPAISALLVFTAVRGAANSFVNTSWNSWMRDIIPGDIMGKFLSLRMRNSTLVAAAVGLIAALYIDWWKGNVPEDQVVFGYSFSILFGSLVLGWAAVAFMSRMPEPRMPASQGPGLPLHKMLSAPFNDKNYRQIMIFTFLRAFAIQLAVPFFTVYMLVRLEMPLTLVVGLGVLSQVSNVLFLRFWGPMVDQFGSKVILSLCTSLYMIVILGWVFTTMPERYALTIPLLVILHALAGIATAGLNISSMTMRMKAAPPAQATAYLTGASLALNLGAGISPLIGGFFADFFSVRQFRINFEWIDPTRTFEFPALFLTGFDFLFAVAFLLGFVALNALARIREEGEVDRETVLNELRAQTRDNFRVLTSVPGMSMVSHFPYSSVQRYMPHVPGLDVAVEVTALQLASSTRDAVSVAGRGGATAAEVAGRVSRNVSRVMRQAGKLGDHYGLQMAREASRGAVHAVGGAAADVQTLARGAVRGTLNALGSTVSDTSGILWGVGYGVVQGAFEAGTDLALAARHAVRGARESAGELGISEDKAVAEVVRGAVEAAEAQGPEAAARVKEAVLEELLENVLPESGVDEGVARGDESEKPGSSFPGL